MGLKSLCLTWTVPMLWAVWKTSPGEGRCLQGAESFLLCKIIENKLLCYMYVLLSIFAQPKLIQHVFRPQDLAEPCQKTAANLVVDTLLSFSHENTLKLWRTAPGGRNFIQGDLENSSLWDREPSKNNEMIHLLLLCSLLTLLKAGVETLFPLLLTSAYYGLIFGGGLEVSVLVSCYQHRPFPNYTHPAPPPR